MESLHHGSAAPLAPGDARRGQKARYLARCPEAPDLAPMPAPARPATIAAGGSGRIMRRVCGRPKSAGACSSAAAWSSGIGRIILRAWGRRKSAGGPISATLSGAARMGNRICRRRSIAGAGAGGKRIGAGAAAKGFNPYSPARCGCWACIRNSPACPPSAMSKGFPGS